MASSRTSSIASNASDIVRKLLEAKQLQGGPTSLSFNSIDTAKFNPVTFKLPTKFSPTVIKCGPSPREARQFFDDMEELGSHHSMTDRQIIEMTLYYGDGGQRVLWGAYATANDVNVEWANFKLQILRGCYPEAFFDLADLDAYIQEPRNTPSETMMQVVRNYFRGFQAIVNDIELSENAHVLDNDVYIAEFFIRGLPATLRQGARSRILPSLSYKGVFQGVMKDLRNEAHGDRPSWL